MKSLTTESMPDSLKLAIGKTLETYAYYKSYLVYRPAD